MRRTILAGLLLFILVPLQAGAQQPAVAPARIVLAGVVVDSLTGQPVVGATVSLEAARRVAFTDSLGRFAVTVPAPGPERLDVRQLGYVTRRLRVDLARSPSPLRIPLAPDPVELKAITARAGRYGRYTIEGTVLDSLTGLPMRGAVVWFRTSRGTATTDQHGWYSYDRARAGREAVIVDVLGYDRRETSTPVSEPWQRLDFKLVPDPVGMRAVIGLNRTVRRMTARANANMGPAVYARLLTDRDLAESGRRTLRDFLIWTRLLDAGSVTLPITRTLPVILDGRPILGGGWYVPDLPLNRVYRIVQLAGRVQLRAGVGGELLRSVASSEGGVVFIFTKDYLRFVYRNPSGRLAPLSQDTLQALIAAADSARLNWR